MRLAILAPLILALTGPSPAEEPVADPPAKARHERLLEIYTGEAEGYAIYRDPGHAEKLELRRQPVYSWTNPVRSSGQDGEVFIWTYKGRPEVIATFFSFPATGPRRLHHELHSLSTATLEVVREGAHTWTPKAPGVELAPIPDAPAPAKAPVQRLAQMRELAREFSATTTHPDGDRWELRILPRPLYRYEGQDPDLPDGTLFAFVSGAGTDPEVILLLEASKPAGAAEPIWRYAVARFTDLNVWVRLKGRDIYSGKFIPHDAPEQDPLGRYRSFGDRGIPPVEEEAPRP